MRMPERLNRLMHKWKLLEYVPLCEYPDTPCFKDCPQSVPQPSIETAHQPALEEVMQCLDRTNEAIDRYLKETNL
jgi:hypothetical protein